MSAYADTPFLVVDAFWRPRTDVALFPDLSLDELESGILFRILPPY